MTHGLEKFDTMFSVRQKPWHGLGKVIENAPNLEEAIQLAGLDWEVVKKPVFCMGKAVKDRFGVCREVEPGNFYPLGIVSNKYQPIQNREAFDFLESIVGEELEYETGGSLFNGAKTFITCKMKKEWIVGDDLIECYLLCSNSHDGKNALKVAITPVRVVCNNTLEEALGAYKRVFSVHHYSNVKDKVDEAKKVLGFANNYMDKFVESGNRMINTRLTSYQMNGMFDAIFGKKEDKTSGRAATIRKNNISCLIDCMDVEDLENYRGTVWQCLNAVSDFETHYKPTTDRMRENAFGRICSGNMELYKKATDYFNAILAF